MTFESRGEECVLLIIYYPGQEEMNEAALTNLTISIVHRGVYLFCNTVQRDRAKRQSFKEQEILGLQ